MTRSQWFLLGSVVVTAALYAIPEGRYVAYPLMLLSTLAHEMGHGIAGVLVGANFEQFVMSWDGSGVATVTGNTSRIGSGIISAGGLVGPAVVGAALIVISIRARLAKWGLAALALFLVLANVLVVRNLFGLAFVSTLAIVLGAVAFKARPWVSQGVALFVATQLALSVFSRGDYLFMETAQTAGGAMPSDVAQMANALFLPYWFWGALCGLFSVAVLAAALWLFMRRGPAPAKPKAAGTPAAQVQANA